MLYVYKLLAFLGIVPVVILRKVAIITPIPDKLQDGGPYTASF